MTIHFIVLLIVALLQPYGSVAIQQSYGGSGASGGSAPAMKSVVVCPNLSIGRILCSQAAPNCPPGLTCTFVGNGMGCCPSPGGVVGGGGGEIVRPPPPPNPCRSRCANRCCGGQSPIGNLQGPNQVQNQMTDQGPNQRSQQGGAGCPNGGFPTSASCGSFGETCGAGMTCLLLTTSSAGTLGCCPLIAADEPLRDRHSVGIEPPIPADLRITPLERFRWLQIIRNAHRVPGSNMSFNLRLP